MIVASDDEIVALSMGDEECDVTDSYVEWVVDSGASHHMTLSREFSRCVKWDILAR